MSIPGQAEIERGIRAAWNFIGTWIPGPPPPPPKKSLPFFPVQSARKGLEMVGPDIFFRLAGLSGAAAVILGAYGAHVMKQKGKEEAREAFETGNRYHLMHSIALCVLPITRNARITGPLMIGGMVLFCGGCYGWALAQNKIMRQVTPFGGVLLILAWLSMAF